MDQSYQFEAQPQAIPNKRSLYRTTIQNDPRVYRGLTFVANENAGNELKQTEANPPTIRKRRVKKRKFDFNKITPAAPSNELILDAYLIEQDYGPETAVVGTQTDEFEPIVKPEPYLPEKTGVDAFTEVETDMVFNFDVEVMPMVEVLVSRMTEKALQELAEENYIKSLQDTQEEFRALQAAEKEKALKQEREEIQRLKAKEQVLRDARERMKREQEIREKILARTAAQRLVSQIKNSALMKLEEGGFLKHPADKAIAIEVLPWIEDQMKIDIQQRFVCRDLVDDLLKAAFNSYKIQQQPTLKHEQEVEEVFEKLKKMRILIKGDQPTEIGPINVKQWYTVKDTEDEIKHWLLGRVRPVSTDDDDDEQDNDDDEEDEDEETKKKKNEEMEKEYIDLSTEEIERLCLCLHGEELDGSIIIIDLIEDEMKKNKQVKFELKNRVPVVEEEEE